MKTIATIIAVFTVSILTVAFAQEQRKNIRKEMKSVEKKVEMEDVNGEKVLTIITTENGNTTEERYVGAEAETKMKEIMSSSAPTTVKKEKVEKQVEMTVENGQKKLVVKETKADGSTTEEVYEGEEAQRKHDEIMRKESSSSRRFERKIEKKND